VGVVNRLKAQAKILVSFLKSIAMNKLFFAKTAASSAPKERVGVRSKK